MNSFETFGIFEVILILILFGFIALMALIYWRIFTKTSYPSALGLLMLIPVVNFFMLLLLAFSEWPIERENRRLLRAACRSCYDD